MTDNAERAASRFRPDVVRGFRVSDSDLAILRSENERLRDLAPCVWSAGILPYQRRARITPRLISAARRAKNVWERFTHKLGA